MLASAAGGSRQPLRARLPFLFPYGYGQVRRYAEQKTQKIPHKAPMRTTTNPSRTSQVKNRNGPHDPSSVLKSSASVSSAKEIGTQTPVLDVEEMDGKEFQSLRQRELAKQLEESGRQLEMMRRAVASGIDPWGQKIALMDLTLPSKTRSVQSFRQNWHNNVQNAISMFRLASEFAFPGKMTKWRFNPQLFKARSTDEQAWVAPFRKDLLDVYEQVNQAIAKGDRKMLSALTAYEFQEHATSLLKRTESRFLSKRLSVKWSLSKLLSPVQILSLRAFPLYTAAEEPKMGNRLCVQALVKFETLQRVCVRDARGREVRKDGSLGPVPKGGEGQGEETGGEERRVLEYLVCENKMFYKDGWYIRDQVFEGVQPKFKDMSSM